MKFVSKFGNLQIVLKPGMLAEPLAGRSAEPGLHARFENGLLETHDEDMITRLLAHPGYDVDYKAVPEGETAVAQPGLEPEHDVVEVQYGQPGKSLNPRPAVKLTPEMTKAISAMAAQLATDMFQKMVAEHEQSKKSADQPSPRPTDEESTDSPAPKSAKSTAKSVK